MPNDPWGPQLTPYDTGERLEPKIWPTHRDDADSYGKVDFENDESATELMIYVERDDSGELVVHIYSHRDKPRVEIEEE